MASRFTTLLRRIVCGAAALGIVPLAALGERAPERRNFGAPADALQARVIVKYKDDNTRMRALAVSGSDASRPQYAASLSLRLRLPLTNGRVLGRQIQGMQGTGMSLSLIHI